MKSTSKRQLVKWLSAALVAGALAAPSARTNYAFAEDGSASVPRASVWTASSLEIDRLGPKYVPLQHPVWSPTATVVRVTRKSFDWADAGVGAGVASLTLVLVAGLAIVVTRRSRRTAGPKRSELAGT